MLIGVFYMDSDASIYTLEHSYCKGFVVRVLTLHMECGTKCPFVSKLRTFSLQYKIFLFIVNSPNLRDFDHNMSFDSRIRGTKRYLSTQRHTRRRNQRVFAVLHTCGLREKFRESYGAAGGNHRENAGNVCAKAANRSRAKRERKIDIIHMAACWEANNASNKSRCSHKTEGNKNRKRASVSFDGDVE